MISDRQDPADRADAPGVAEIERRFRSPTVLTLRPIILGGLRVLRTVRRFGWTGVGTARLLDLEPPLIFAANHASHTDTGAILGTLPHPIRRRTCVAAALDVFGPASGGEKHTLNGWRRECLQVIVAAGFHAFAFDRHGPPLRSLRTAVGLVRNGWSLLLYPEGTRSRTGRIGPFKPGVGIVARSTGRPVVPVHVCGGETIQPCGTFLPGPGLTVARFGPPLTLRGGESARAFTARLRERVCALDPAAAAAPRPRPREEPPALAALAAVAPAGPDVHKQSA